ncbi:MAG: universal stress protein, partial [Flavobacterium sp.]
TYDDWKSHFALEPVQFHIIPNDDVEATIADFISGNSIDVLAMMTYKKGFFAQLFAQSFTEKMANHLSIPVLAMHE